MIRSRGVLALVLVSAVAAAGDDSVERIVGAAHARGGALQFLELLSDGVGGRMTGTPQARAAQDLLLQTLRQAGLSNVHAEEWTLRSSWQRGAARAEVLAPAPRALAVQSFGWAPGTAGRVEAPLLDLGKVAGAALAQPAERLRGSVVIAEPEQNGDEPGFITRAALARQLQEAGAVALLVPSDKPGRLLDIGCFGNYPRAALPMLSLAREDALLLRRLLARGAVRLALEVENRFGASPVAERNVVAEIPGRTLPAEVVILGAHLDSWDTGQGAEDDGSGVAAVLEVARILKSLGLQPKRTLRFVFWSGEEQAILGSQAYVAAHAAELDAVRAVLVMDSGAGRPLGFKLQGRQDLEPGLREALRPLAALGADGLSQDASFDQDHAFFLAAGVPALTLWVDHPGYSALHHAVTDTFDKVDPRALAQATAVMAVAGWSLSESATPIGPRLAPEAAMAHLKKLGLESSYRMALQPQ